MNLPNALTLLRIFFVPLLVAALVQGHVTIDLGFMEITNEMLALSLFLAAAATDLLDGYLARTVGAGHDRRHAARPDRRQTAGLLGTDCAGTECGWFRRG